MANNDVQFCPKCGTKNIKGGKFCKSCGAQLPGAKISEEKQPQATVTPEPAPANNEDTQSIPVMDSAASASHTSQLPRTLYGSG